MGGDVGESGVAVAADARATEEVNAGVKFVMDEWHTSVRADSARGDALVVGRKPGGRAFGRSGDSRAGEGPCSEGTHYAENLVVAPPWIESCLENEIRALVKGVVGLVIIQTSQIARRCNQAVLGLEFAAESGLRIFHGQRHRQLVVREGLRDPETKLTRPTEADVILRVNRHWTGFGERLGSFLGFSHQAPHLAAGDGPAAFEGRLRPELPLAERIAVRLVVVRGDARGQKVTLEVAADLDVVELALNPGADLRLASGKVQVIHVGVGGASERNSLEVRIHVVGNSPLPVHGFRSHEPAGSDCDSLEANLVRIRLVFIR